MQLLPMASSLDGLISARYAVITKTPGWKVLTTTSNVNVTQGLGGGGGRGLGHNLLVQFFSLGNSKMEISQTDFFDTLAIQNDQISYVKHV